MADYGIQINDFDISDANFRNGTVHFYNVLYHQNDWNDIVFEGCYPSLPKLADDEYAIVVAMPLQYHADGVRHPSSFMMPVFVYKDENSKNVVLSRKNLRGFNPTDKKNTVQQILFPAVFYGTGNPTKDLIKGSGIIENGIEKPISYSPNINSRELGTARGYFLCMVYK